MRRTFRGLTAVLLLAACRNEAGEPAAAARSSDVSPAGGHTVSFVGGDSLPSIGGTLGALDGVRLGMSERDVRRLWGAPDSVGPRTYEDNVGDTVVSWHYAGRTAVFHGGRAEELDCSATTCATAEGVRIGDPELRVATVYGRPGVGRPLAERILRYQLGPSDCWLDFHAAQGRVTRMSAACDNS